MNAPEAIDGTMPTLRFSKCIEFGVGDHGFEILVGGHGPVGVKSDVTAGRVYMEELRGMARYLQQSGAVDR